MSANSAPVLVGRREDEKNERVLPRASEAGRVERISELSPFFSFLDLSFWEENRGST